ncbi:vinorine synthase-like [Olea europaea var. sylvestris]|uniref:vinorine synthase-like n=1 Tax=Olea europaea var. sylvestris TaxID=158386 RepID=UPI000C1CF537|nr:vinorine synthase-like [Olea europaea var. sylvestris]
MEGNVEIISKYMIKPSSPTSPHLKILKLSFLDQIAPPVYMPIIFFYQADELGSKHTDHAHNFQLLKQSLSNTLTLFYPLAGRIHENSYVDCNDAGAELIETRVHANVSDVIEEPHMQKLQQYLPVKPSSVVDAEAALLAVQINFFDCGGTVIGVCLSHKIADGTSLVTFIEAWAATCRGESKIMQSNFDLAALFPPKDFSTYNFRPSDTMTSEKIVTKRFVFDKDKLVSLKEAAAVGSELLVKNPTRVEAVSAYIWRHFIEMAKGKTEKEKMFAAVHAVNLRSRTSPPLPEHAFGNCWSIAFTLFTADDPSNLGYGDLITKLGGAIRKIDGDYIKQKKNEENWNRVKKLNDPSSKVEIELCNFSSWCRFPVYQVNYGWGEPLWVCTTTMPFKNVVLLMSTKTGDGIEAWVNMLEDDVDKLQIHE